MKKIWISAMLAGSLLAMPAAYGAGTDVFTATLAGDSEVPPNNSAGSGSFKMTIDNSTSTPVINFTFTYEGLFSNPTFSHIHFGQHNVAGGVMIFLCGGGGQPACPASTSGTITGTITAANVTGPTAQGIDAGNLTAALEAIEDGDGYVNIHNAKFPAGEMRGQLRRGAGHGKGKEK